MSTHSLRWQAAAVERQCCNYRSFVERKADDKRWPEADVDRARLLLAALDDAAITLRRLADHEADARFADLFKIISE